MTIRSNGVSVVTELIVTPAMREQAWRRNQRQKIHIPRWVDETAEAHILVRIDHPRSVYFLCAKNPKLEMNSPGAPARCPVCSALNPIQLKIAQLL